MQKIRIPNISRNIIIHLTVNVGTFLSSLSKPFYVSSYCSLFLTTINFLWQQNINAFF